jgi:ribosomal protein S18 acetylase RimI-like enzyme
MGLDNISFRLLDKRDEDVINECTLLMSNSEPWLTLRRTYDDIIEIIDDETSEVHLAQLENKTVGFAIIRLRGAFVGYVQSIMIRPQCRNQGFGRAFMKYLEGRIFTEHPNVFICVSSFNTDAQRLYKELGYEAIGALKDYIVRGHSEILMRKSRGPLSEFKT